jgi:hypothetical protein
MQPCAAEIETIIKFRFGNAAVLTKYAASTPIPA